jgi:hypothetical protein
MPIWFFERNLPSGLIQRFHIESRRTYAVSFSLLALRLPIFISFLNPRKTIGFMDLRNSDNGFLQILIACMEGLQLLEVRLYIMSQAPNKMASEGVEQVERKTTRWILETPESSTTKWIPLNVDINLLVSAGLLTPSEWQQIESFDGEVRPYRITRKAQLLIEAGSDKMQKYLDDFVTG